MGGITIDISYYPKTDDNVKLDTKGYYYESGKVRVNLTEDWYPDPEGTYRKLTHTPKGGKISKVKKGKVAQNVVTDLGSYSSVTVYYWSGDHTFNKPLLIQLGSGNGDYYTDPEGDNTWSKDSSAASDLRERLNKQNCERNQVHIINLSYKSSTTYQCPSCRNNAKIKVSYSSGKLTEYSIHSITGSKLSVVGFKYDNKWQVGLPSLKDVENIKVEWYKSGGKNPLLIVYQSPPRYFRKNKGDENTWTEVSKYNSHSTLTTPQLIPDLSKQSENTYSYNDILITVRNAPLGNGYWKYQHSLRGGLFKATIINHNGTQLPGISSQEPLDSVIAYYLGDDPDSLDNLIMVELEKNNGGQDKYEYYIRQENSQNSWTTLRRQGETGKLYGSSLTDHLSQLKNDLNLGADEDVHPSADPQKQVIINAVGGTVGGLVAAGALVALAKIFWPAIVTSSATL